MISNVEDFPESNGVRVVTKLGAMWYHAYKIWGIYWNCYVILSVCLSVKCFDQSAFMSGPQTVWRTPITAEWTPKQGVFGNVMVMHCYLLG